MYGLEAIHAYNGWAMAFTGAVIVMTGLTVLSFLISQIRRIVDILDSRTVRKSKKKHARVQASAPESHPVPSSLSDLHETMKRFSPLTRKIGDSFDLKSLFQLFIQHDDPHPHLTIRTLREQGYLVPAGEGLFAWRQQ